MIAAMTLRHRWPALAATLALGLSACVVGRAARSERTITPKYDMVVSRDSSGDYSSICAAVAASTPGAVILVRPGVYSEWVTIGSERRVTLVGTDPAVTVIDGSGGYACIEVKGDSNRFINLCLQGADAHGAWVRDGYQQFEHCLIRGNGSRGIYLSAMAGNAAALIDHCTIADHPDAGVHIARNNPSTEVRNCIVAFNGRGIVAEDSSGTIAVRHNLVWNDSLDFGRIVPEEGNVRADPQFVDRDDSDYRLRKRSPAAGSASDGRNRGCF